jgi:hypothetical protein
MAGNRLTPYYLLGQLCELIRIWDEGDNTPEYVKSRMLEVRTQYHQHLKDMKETTKCQPSNESGSSSSVPAVPDESAAGTHSSE